MLAFNPSLEAAELRGMIADIAQTITLASGAVVSASVTTGGESDGLDIAGITSERKLTAVVAAADCAVFPVANDVILFSGGRYRVQDVTYHDDGVGLTIQAVGEFE